MNGIVLAAGEGKRLRPLTAALPKTLLALRDGQSILEFALANLRAVGLDRVVIVTGHAAERIERRVPEFEERFGIAIELVFNERALDWNNAYSLWLARAHFADGALLVNGDTVHPKSVQQRLLEDRGPGILLALDDRKQLNDEAMKVVLDGDGRLQRIHKALDPATAHGEYIGVTLIEQQAATRLAEALAATWERDPSLYYEDGFQQYADWGGEIRTVPIGTLDWVEVDDHEDLRRARALACRS